ncbi:hypothetical protein AAC387_Pa04g0614 [Persea americana]
MKKLKKKKRRGKEVNACSNDNNRPSKRAAIIEVMGRDPCEPNANLLDDKSFDRSVVLAGADGQNQRRKKRKKRRQRANISVFHHQQGSSHHSVS